MDEKSIVLESGSENTRFGWSGKDEPESVITTVLGKTDEKGYLYGQECLEKCENPEFPIIDAKITNWAEMEELWRHIFYDRMKIVPSEHPVITTEYPPYASGSEREKITSIFFESFSVPKFYLYNTASLTLYSSGRTLGTVLDIGYTTSYSCPIYSGHALPYPIQTRNIGGKHVTEYLKRLILERTSKEMKIQDLKHLKHNLYFISTHNEKNSQQTDEKTQEFTLLDDSKITIGDERHKCTEILFNPSLVDSNYTEIHQMLARSIECLDVGQRKDNYQNIVLSGGSASFNGLIGRLEYEMKDLMPRNARLKINPPRKNSSWIGASILSSLSTFENMWISKDDFEDYGPSIVQRKCF